jgi:hypothetical protein
MVERRIGRLPLILSLLSKPLNFGPDGHHSSAFSIHGCCAGGQRSGEGIAPTPAYATGIFFLLFAMPFAIEFS